MDDRQKEDIKQIIRRMPSYIKLIYKLYRDGEVPKSAKVTLSMALGYNISPIDLIPGFIPLIGQIDNIYFTLKLLRKAIKSCPHHVADRHLESSGITMDYIDKDIETSGQLMKEVGRQLLKTSGKAVKASTSAVYRLGKGIFASIHKKDKE